MNVVDGLRQIRDRLEGNGADPATLATVDLFIQRASMAPSASAASFLQLVRMLMRTPAADSNVRVYNDLAKLEEELEHRASDAQAQKEAEDARPVPKTKKYYKEQKEREKRAANS
jgi:hypothetical protein